MLVSIVIPVYNAESVLSTCIDSVLSQSYANIEVLLINDGSTDNSGAICENYAAIDNRIRYTSSKNAGPSAARNLGISLAKGEYLMFVDADDFIDSSIVEVLLATITKNNIELAICTYMSHMFSENKEVARNPFKLESKKIFIDDFLNLNTLDLEHSQSIRARAHTAGNIWGRLYVLDVIRKNNLQFDTKLRRYEDVLFNICYLIQIKEVYVLNNNLYHYCVNLDYASLSDEVTKDKFHMLETSYSVVSNRLANNNFDYLKYYYSYIIMGHIIRIFQKNSPFSFFEAYYELKNVCSSEIYIDVIEYYQTPRGGSIWIPIFLKNKLFLLASITAKIRMLKATLSKKPIRQWCFDA